MVRRQVRGQAAQPRQQPGAPWPGPTYVERRVVRVRRRRSRLTKALLITALVLAVAAGIVLAGGLLAVHRINSSVSSTNLLGDARAPKGAGNGPRNYLLIGSNWRDDDPGNGERADSIIVVHIPRGSKRAYLISVPRDLYYTIKPYPPTGFEGSTEKIDAALNYGGMRLMSQTVSDLIGVKFNGAVVARFDGFQKAVRALGGVDMCVDERTVSVHIGHDQSGHTTAPYTNLDGDPQPIPGVTPVVYEPGCQHMAPWQALDYVRQRELLPGGDYDRQRHQQQFIMAVLKQSTSAHMLTDPVKLDRVSRDIGHALTTDTNGVPLTSLALAMRGINAGNLVGLRTPSHPDDVDGTAYVMPDDDMPDLWRAVREDRLGPFAANHRDLVNPLNPGGH